MLSQNCAMIMAYQSAQYAVFLQKISKIYNGDTLSDCIKDIIKQSETDQGKSYRLEVRENKLYVEPYSDLVIKASFKPASNIAAFDPANYPADEMESESIADMANTIKSCVGQRKIGTDFRSRTRSCKRCKIRHAAKGGAGRAKRQRSGRESRKKIFLLELNKVTKTKTVKLLGDDTVRSGRILNYQGAAYLVMSCTHNYSGTVHTMDLTLEAV